MRLGLTSTSYLGRDMDRFLLTDFNFWKTELCYILNLYLGKTNTRRWTYYFIIISALANAWTAPATRSKLIIFIISMSFCFEYHFLQLVQLSWTTIMFKIIVNFSLETNSSVMSGSGTDVSAPMWGSSTWVK